MTVLLDLDEDNPHIACAVEARLDAIVTRNPNDFADSPVPVLTPAELLALHPKAPDVWARSAPPHRSRLYPRAGVPGLGP